MNNSNTENAVWKPRLVIIGVVAAFVTPVLLSWYLVFFTDFNRSHGGVEHGILLTPPRQIGNLLNFPAPDPGTAPLVQETWTMLVLTRGKCDKPCNNNLFRMQQIRLSMGREMTRVDRIIALDNNATKQASAKDIDAYQGTRSVVIGTDHNSKFLVNGKYYPDAIYLVDPSGYLMMVYPQETDPGGIIKDLKRLLRISKVN